METIAGCTKEEIMKLLIMKINERKLESEEEFAKRCNLTFPHLA